MKQLRWNLLKNERLKQTRGASFEDVVQAKLIGVKRHPAKKHQGVMPFEYRRYIWVIPFIEDEEGFFLKTLYPSRKYTRMYKRGEIQ